MKWEVMSWAETAGAEQRILSPSTTASLQPAAPPKLVHVQPTRDRPSTAAARLRAGFDTVRLALSCRTRLSYVVRPYRVLVSSS